MLVQSDAYLMGTLLFVFVLSAWILATFQSGVPNNATRQHGRVSMMHGTTATRLRRRCSDAATANQRYTRSRSQPRMIRPAVYFVAILVATVLVASPMVIVTDAMVLRRLWTTQQWCHSVKKPRWPFAYQKHTMQTVEWKGRTNSNDQDMRHECTVFGVQSKCHHCEDIACGSHSNGTCAYQIQGVDWARLPKNIPTVTDVPWAVGGTHRYDYGKTTNKGVCQFLSGGDCITPHETDYSKCTVRCWGVAGSGAIQSRVHPERGDSETLANGDADAADIWSYPPDFSGNGKPQGQVTTLAGSGAKGFLDGAAASALFNNPQDVAVDSKGTVYVADTDNHRIRRIDGVTQMVTTLAGDGVEGYKDGISTAARFSYPTGIAVYDDAAQGGKVVVFVADTGNHRIRKIVDGVVSCYAGLCGNGVESAIVAAKAAVPHAGLADGDATNSRFDSPMGIAVDLTGVVFVADTGNHLVRRIAPDGTTWTLAGNVAPSNDVDTPGCVSPCLRGVAGFRDGNLTHAQFNSPRDVAIGPQSTVVVADSHRIRRINYDGTTSLLEGVTSSNRVVTLAGSSVHGNLDGAGDEATFHAPAGVTVSADGRVYVVSPITCKLRQLSTATRVARPVSCSTRLTQVLLPSGCSSYEPPVDELFLRGSPVTNNIYYNYRQRRESDLIDGPVLRGRQIKDCTGTPPIDAFELGDMALAKREETSPYDPLANEKEDREDGTTIKLKCPSSCASSVSTVVYGSHLYTDESSICKAAIHAGAISHATGGLIEVTLERGIHYYNVTVSKGSTAKGVTSLNMPPKATSAARLFSVKAYPLAQIEVHTVAGAPSAQLKSGCGFVDAMPPLAAQFRGPHGVEIYKQHSLTRSHQLVVADSWNHRIRRMTASCAKICENGATCVAPDTCACTAGWSGDDCSIPVCSTPSCAGRQVCVAPETCACIPGYTGAPACTTPLCVQSCANGGSCVAPDTCDCASGWFDSNCTTPVCTQTCGNGGNCTAPDTCSCPHEWAGPDCRVPVCTQHCANGGACVSPDTCLCAAGWSGHDCKLPVCSQGFFVAHPSAYNNALWRPFSFENYVPCDWAKWCDATNEFDCLSRLTSPLVDVAFGPQGRAATGRVRNPRLESPLQVDSHPHCMLIELGATAIAHYQYMDHQNITSGFFRFSPKVPYGWNASFARWRGLIAPEMGFLPPFNHASDRQVALVEKRNVVQGVYACANGGSCLSPGVCTCAPGWIGFDCRTPVCTQGYYTPMQPTYIAADPPQAKDPRQPISNPQYVDTVETISYTQVATTTVTRGGVRYASSTGAQGGYACSMRSVTQWEKPSTIGPYASPEYYLDHPNYFSGYMDKTIQLDGYYHTYWEGMFWPPLYELTKPLLDDTRQGWKRGGTWQRVATHWQKGKCLVEFDRTCTVRPMVDLLTSTEATRVSDTDASYRPQVTYSIARADRVGFWNHSVTGDCVDEVIHGCFNNGTCIAPDTCRCANGWTGPDCSVPVCSQPCLHNGNCTLPNRCTCEIGWTGHDCSIALCAQECRNGAKCVAPDTCACVQWASKWRDGREDGGEPVFKTPEGQAQLTGYTGYDCNTPICVQAKTFVLNTKREAKGFTSLRGHGKTGNDICSSYRCPQFDEELISNDGTSFQSGCSVGNPRANPRSILSEARKLANLRNYSDVANTRRTSDGFLCGNLVWDQGDYTLGRSLRLNYINITKHTDDKTALTTWTYGTTTPGEGVFMCYHKGSCIAPDTCSCGDGWQGIDCNIPICRFLQANGSVVTGCLNGGVCTDKDTCKCITVESSLREIHPTAPRGATGFTGADCAIPMCIQGVFDPLCALGGSSVVDGCYKCKNGGLCIGPDVCQCAEGWTGFDCSQPICSIPRAAVNATVKSQLFTVDDDKVLVFMADPCGSKGGRWGKELVNGALIGQGNCTLPAKCTCLCRQKYDAKLCKETGEFCELPWQDPFHRSIPPGFIYGTKHCVDGFQGLEDAEGNFLSCHLQIYVPSLYRRYTVSMVALLSVFSVLALVAWNYIRKNIKRRRLLAKAERRRSRKNSEENPVRKPKASAFIHAKQA